MRVERTGPVPKLTPRLERFFIESLGGKPLDDVLTPETRRADFLCLRGLLAIELKTLEEDASKRLNNLTDELRERPDWPIFLGAAPIDAILKHLDEPEAVKRQMADRIGRAIKNHMRKANKQLGAHRNTFKRQNLLRLMFIANEDHEIYDPNLVAHIVQRHLLRRDAGQLLYPNIDAVFFLSERHVAPVNYHVSFPIMCIESDAIEEHTWKRELTELVIKRWAAWNGHALYFTEPETVPFTPIDHIPKEMKRYEQWELDYRRDPYMRSFTQEKLRERFDEIICITSLRFIRNSPLSPDRTAMIWSLSSMSHIMIEMGYRGITAPDFQHDPKRLAAAARRLRLPQKVIDWFERDLGREAA